MKSSCAVFKKIPGWTNLVGALASRDVFGGVKSTGELWANVMRLQVKNAAKYVLKNILMVMLPGLRVVLLVLTAVLLFLRVVLLVLTVVLLGLRHLL